MASEAAAGVHRRSRVGTLAVVLGALVVAVVGGLDAGKADAADRVTFGEFCNVAGEAAGQCREPLGVAVNQAGTGGAGAGDVYVADNRNNRIDVFSAEGSFVMAFGEGVDQDTGGDVCTAASGDTCKAGLEGEGAGSVRDPQGIGIDQATGTVYVTSGRNRRVDVFSATGAFEGAFGWSVNESAPAEALQFCTTATGCQAGPTTDRAVMQEAGAFSTLHSSQPAVDPSSGAVYIPDGGNRRMDEFMPSYNAGHEVEGVSFVRAFGWSVDKTTPEPRLQECTVSTGCTAGASSAGRGSFKAPHNAAVDAAGAIYVVNGGGFDGRGCVAAEPCGVDKFSPDLSTVEEFAPEQLTHFGDTAVEQEPFAVAIDPRDGNVLVAKKAAASEYGILEFDAAGALQGSSGGFPGTAIAVGLAFGAPPYAYLSTLGTRPQGQVYRLGFAPAPAAPATPTCGSATATSVHCEGDVEVDGFATTYQFEYCPVEAGCAGEANWHGFPDRPVSLGDGEETVTVSQTISGLDPNTAYELRIAAATSATVHSEPPDPVVRTRAVKPRLIETFAGGIGRTSASLAALVDPRHSPTTYHVEWADQAEWEAGEAYGHRAPPTGEASAGSGVGRIAVEQLVTGLAAGASYHFRLVARNGVGTVVGPDHRFVTLNASGFPDRRGAELVSPAERGPVAAVSERVNGLRPQLLTQVSPDGSAAAFELAPGALGAVSGAESLHTARRTSTGWRAEDIAPPVTRRTNTAQYNFPSVYLYLAPDLGCGVLRSQEPVTADAPSRTVEEGGENLFRRNPDGTYTVLTRSVPTNLGSVFLKTNFTVVGASPSCDRVLFETQYHYEGASLAGPTTNTPELYEWNEALTPRLRHVGVIPAGAGEQEVAAHAGNASETEGGSRNYLRAVSQDGTGVIFSATRLTSPNPAEVGKTAVFLRREGLPTLDVSLSATGTPDSGATYQYASRDGSRIFFTANAGLTAASSAAGTDLYACDVVREAGHLRCELSDLSVDRNPADTAGAAVAGVVAGSDDGAYVYFAAQGQLVAGEGRTYAENAALDSYNLYLSRSGSVSYVAGVTADDLRRVLVEGGASYSSQASADGRHLVFESGLDLTGYEAQGVPEAYLYGTDRASVVCVSCRRDGGPPIGDAHSPRLGTAIPISDFLNPRQVISDRGDRVFFESPDPLAPGAVAGNRNVYEWEDGNVYLLASAAAKVPGAAGTAGLWEVEFGGASRSGDDVFIVTTKRLTPAAKDGRRALYDLRVGGGFPAGAGPPAPCDSLREGACQGPAAGAPPAATPVTPHFAGPGDRAARGRSCARFGRRARKLSRRGNKLRRRARHPEGRRARRLRHKADRLATRASRDRKRAKSCRRAGRPESRGRRVRGPRVRRLHHHRSHRLGRPSHCGGKRAKSCRHAMRRSAR